MSIKRLRSGGTGGTALGTTNSSVFAAASTLTGGAGGASRDLGGWCLSAGAGGAAASGSGALLFLAGCRLVAGLGGAANGICTAGPPGPAASQLAPTAPLREALDIDSFDFLNVLVGLHQTLGVEIPESDYGQLTTLDSLRAYLRARVVR